MARPRVTLSDKQEVWRALWWEGAGKIMREGWAQADVNMLADMCDRLVASLEARIPVASQPTGGE